MKIIFPESSLKTKKEIIISLLHCIFNRFDVEHVYEVVYVRKENIDFSNSPTE